MRVERLKLDGFRNLADPDFSPCGGVNVICGGNAQGKTNLLEAIWLFCGARGFRGARDAEYVAFGGEQARMDMTFFSQGRSQSASISMRPGQKQVNLNGIKQESVSALSGVFCAVVFSPDHLELVKGEPVNRRRLMDDSLCQAYPKYAKVLDGYERILRQRAFLLKDAQEHPQAFDLLDAWDKNMVEYGGYLIWMRSRYAARLSRYAGEIYAGISGGGEIFDAFYRPSCGELEPGAGRAEAALRLEKALEESRAQDIRLGRTSVGPHRDDLEIELDGKSARSFGSQGQQRSCVLALKLAECRILEESAGEPPVILLDDVMSELDEQRRTLLLEALDGRQAFVTCCDAKLFSGVKGGQVYGMKSGQVDQAEPGPTSRAEATAITQL